MNKENPPLHRSKRAIVHLEETIVEWLYSYRFWVFNATFKSIVAIILLEETTEEKYRSICHK
jgi:hypothetical protein